ncbi:MAG: PEGA domain-containing protein [Calditrichaeota bacterium]|nr:PEGA domain-containing protein [Calditrichota bacterium]
MNRCILCFILVFLLITQPILQLVMGQVPAKRVNIAVFDFEGKGISAAEAAALTDRFRSVLVETQKFTVVEREKINLILEEIGLQMSGVISEESISQAGKLLGVQQIITGSIGKIEDTYTVDLRIVNVETGKVTRTMSENVSGSKENLIALLERLAKQLAGIRIELKTFEIKIFSEPGNSSVYVDGKYLGLSPLVATLEEGVHEVRIKHDGYREWKGKVKVNKAGKLTVKLEKKASRKKTWFWVGAGTLVAGGGILAAVLLGSKQGAGLASEQEEPIGLPPLPPGQK